MSDAVDDLAKRLRELNYSPEADEASRLIVEMAEATNTARATRDDARVRRALVRTAKLLPPVDHEADARLEASAGREEAQAGDPLAEKRLERAEKRLERELAHAVEKAARLKQLLTEARDMLEYSAIVDDHPAKEALFKRIADALQ
jgi:hypothetical protein